MQKIKLCRNLKIKWEILKDGSAVTLDGLNLTLILVNYFGTREMAFSTDESYVVCVIKDSEQLNPGEYWFALYQDYLTDKQSLVSVCDHFELVADPHCCESSEVTIGGDSSCDCGPNLELGVQGDSAYAIWLKNGHEGSEEDFIAWLQEPSNDAAEKADTATQNAIQATADAKSATELANVAASKATASASTADSAAQSATASAEQAQTATENANNAASNANKMADYANESASNANTATQEAKNATAQAIASAKSADESAAYAKEQGDYAKGFIDKVDDIEASLSSVQELIPNTATSENQLADKEFVNSSITTNTATFKGTFETADDLPTTDVKANDYAFVIATDSTGNPEYQRYKYSNNAWAFEYTLNNSSFTAEQWAAITSGITSTKITSLEDADKSLTDKINAEATAREAEDTALNEAVTALQAIPVSKGTGSGALVANTTGNKAAGLNSFASGDSTKANGNGSHAEGVSTTASGYASHAEGISTTTSGTTGAHAQGQYNEDDTNLIHSVGIGSSATRKNAEAIYTDGKKYVKGVGNYDGTKASIASGAKDVATVANEATAHIASTDNPHKVTASQIGASTPAEVTSAIATHNTASDAHSDIRKEVADCVRKTGADFQRIEGALYLKNSASADARFLALALENYNENGSIQVTISDSTGDIDGAAILDAEFMSRTLSVGTTSLALRLISNQRPEVDEYGEMHSLAYDDEVPHITLITKNTDIGDLKDAVIGPYIKDANTLVSGTLPDGVSKYDRFRLEVLPLGDSYVEQRMTVPTNGTVAVYSRIWNGSSWGSWVDAHSDIRTLISNETSARQSADTALEAKIPTTSEDFVFTLEDGTEVTKSIYVK